VTLRRYWSKGKDGRLVSFYGLGQSLAFVPFDIAGAALARLTEGTPDFRRTVAWLPVALGLLPLLGLLWWHLLRKVLVEGGFQDGPPALYSAAALLGTIAFFYVGNEQEECLAGCLTAGAFLFALRANRTGEAGDAALSGLFGGLALLTRADMIFGIIPGGFVLAGAALRGDPKRAGMRLFGAAATGGALPVAVAALYNRARFGSVFETGYRAFGFGPLWKLDGRCWGTMLALLFGPGKGLFVLSPLLVFAVFGFRKLLRRLPWAGYGTLVGFACAVGFYSGFYDVSDGAWSWGTRYLAYFATYWTLPLAYGFELAWRGRRIRRALLVVAAASACIQMASVFMTQNLEYYQMQAQSRDDFRSLLTSGPQGQLARRLANIARWVGRRPEAVRFVSPSPSAGSAADHVRLIFAGRIPNFWGPSLGRSLGGVSGAIVVAAWGICLAGGLGILLGIALSCARSPRPVRER
jgi:hypothetical protein